MLKPIPIAEAGADVPVRTPPHNFEAEQALLGAILLNNRAVERVSEFLQPGHFAEPLHRRVYEACLALTSKNQIADANTVRSWLGNDPELMAQGGHSYLGRLVGAATTVINALDYGKLIYDLHLRRELIALGEEVVNDAFDPKSGDEGGVHQVELAETKLFNLASAGETEGGFKPLGISLASAINQAEIARKRDGKLSGITTGFRDLDGALGGLHSSDLIILAARPSMGKTSLATNMAFRAAEFFRHDAADGGEKKTVAFFSLEMSAEQLATRIIAERARIPSHDIRRGFIPRQEDFERLSIAASELNNLPLYIDDTPALSIAAVRTRARRLSRTHGLGMVCVDYLQLLSSPSDRNRDNRVQEISDITRGLKALAKDLKVPVLALSQLSRAVEQREDKRPQLADLRESGTIEQDADVVMFIYREEYYVERRKPTDGSEEMVKWQADMEKVHNKAEVMIAKQRHGPIKNVNLFFNGQFTMFGDLDEQHGDDYGD